MNAKKLGSVLFGGVIFMSTVTACGGEGGGESSSPYVPSEGEIDLVLEEQDTYNVYEGLGIDLQGAEASVSDIVSLEGNVLKGLKMGRTSIEYGNGERLDVKVVMRHDLDTFIRFDRGAMYGKKFVVYGDSISARATLAAGEKDYKDNLAQALGFTYDCFAVSGSLFTYKYSHENINPPRTCGAEYIEMNSEANAEADYALIWYGTNDFACNVDIGSPSDTAATASETDTLYSSIRYAVAKLRADNPDIRIIFFTMLYRDDKHVDEKVVNNNGTRLTKYGSAVQFLSDELGYTVYDLFPVFSHEDFTANSTYTKDGLHPSEAGHAVISEYLLNLE